ncbi:MAG TPA: damage-inducible protein DinB [Rhodobacteraceae bacterium]|jgi:uncharacterized damage-inducible protein DinB|nr:damage-inducible protein DinB [Paracoccaceae bacterium]HBV53440.1 damage-inducible protein DinB [Paracoccaceae bacterium]
MITRDTVRMLARYNAWQNSQMLASMEHLSIEELLLDRGAFFRSILGTANHLLWGDAMWMHRFDHGPKPDIGIHDSPSTHPTLATWSAARFRMDGRIRLWADKVPSVALAGDRTFFSSVLNREVTKPVAPMVLHMFNHQTHHRGQIHAMLTAAGVGAPVSDLFFMPEE